jgi:hypothetical protein
VFRSSTYPARARLAGALTVLGLAVLGLGLASPARAAELSLAGPAQCGDVDELRYRVERALGSALAAAPPLVLDVTIAQRARELSATLRVRDEAGATPSERRLEAEDCAHLLDALSVVIVLAIDRVRAREQAEPERARPAVTEPLPSAPAASPERADEDEMATRAPSWRPSVLAWLAGDYGSLPDPDLGVGLGLSLDGTRARLQASGLFFFEQHTELEGQGLPAPGADVGLALGALSACYAPSGSWQSDGVLGACARAEVGRLFGRGANVLEERSGGRLWVAPGLSLVGQWRVLAPSVRVGFEGGAVLPLLRSEFRLGTLGDLYRPAAIAARLGLGVAIVLE